MNGYFQLVITDQGTGIRVFAATEGGVSITTPDVREYLDKRSISYDLVALDQAVSGADGNPKMINNTKIMAERESCRLTVSDDEMTVTGYFYPPSDGVKGEEMTAAEVKSDLGYQKVTYGIQEETIAAFFAKREYCKEIVLAQGKPVREGSDASIEYLFNTDMHAKPEIKEDGTVDFFNLNLISHVQEGDEVAKLTPEDPGEDGWNVYGKPVMPQKVKHLELKGNKNTALSEDKLTLKAAVSGHVSLSAIGVVEVSNVFTVPEVGVSSGNINYDGSIVVNGDVDSGYEVKASGDIEVKGSVSGAILRAKGNVVLTRGMNGMTKGEIHAGGNVVTKFLEAATVRAGGTVSAESIMRSTVFAGAEIYVDGKRGFIAGGQVSAKERITAKTLGSELGVNTLVEVGADPTLKESVKKMQAEIADAEKKKEAIQEPLANLLRKLKAGVTLTPEQLKYLQQLNMQNKILDGLIEKNTKACDEAKQQMKDAKRAEVIVNETAYPGTTIGIADYTRDIKTPVKYSRFVIDEGEIRIAGL
ncbi:MAG: DUF342 domain-containing protein [Lachnospiraceae bacterium]|nr:DUF342 domain-containing protein [Lachnospiraceae bacterium]